jgi:hypothetical protein
VSLKDPGNFFNCPSDQVVYIQAYISSVDNKGDYVTRVINHSLKVTRSLLNIYQSVHIEVLSSRSLPLSSNIPANPVVLQEWRSRHLRDPGNPEEASLEGRESVQGVSKAPLSDLTSLAHPALFSLGHVEASLALPDSNAV